jgi:hypothetical protein
LEGRIAPSLRRVAQCQPLSDEDSEHLGAFVAMMMLRVPAVHGNVQRFISELAQKLHVIWFQAATRDPRWFEATKADYRRDTGRSDVDDLRPEDLSPDRISLRATRTAAIGAAFSGFAVARQHIMEMGCRLLVTKAPDYFVTSDNPFYMIDPTIPPSSAYGQGLGFRNIEVTLPLAGRGTTRCEHGNVAS